MSVTVNLLTYLYIEIIQMTSNIVVIKQHAKCLKIHKQDFRSY